MELAIPTFESLYQQLPDSIGNPVATPIDGVSLPTTYQTLLNHQHHMTVTVERFYADSVDVSVLETLRHEHYYTRKILLSLATNRRVVQFGLVQIDLDLLPPIVREQILAERTPLGRVLIQNDVLTSVHLETFIRVEPNLAMCGWFAIQPENPPSCYGRLGVILANGRPAIQMLEVLAPIDAI